MVQTMADTGVSALPPAPRNPLPVRQQVRALRSLIDGVQQLIDAGGPVTRIALPVPRWLAPPVVLASSPQGIHDILGRQDGVVEKTKAHEEMRHLLGNNVFDLTHDAWLPRRRALQPVFTKKHVRRFSGHMSQAAEMIVAGWQDGADVDLDTECRRLTLRALGRSVLGADLDERADTLAAPMQTTLEYIADRALRPIRAPRWLPTPARRRARAASRILRGFTGDMLQACRDDPTRDAPLVRALMDATDPETGQPLSDSDIRDELIVFLIAGHDTTATALAHSLWQLGRHPDLQDRVAAEVSALGDRELTPDDLPQLGYTVQVLHEALRLCPPGATGIRIAKQDIAIDGYRVEAGTLVAFAIAAVHRDPRYWADPMVFDPDRFAPENSKGRDRWEYLPFGAGPRSCIGDHFAMLEATLALATIVRGVEIRSQRDDFPLATPFTTVAAEPVPARINRRAPR